MSWAAVCLAVALLIAPGATAVRNRARGYRPPNLSRAQLSPAADPLAAASCLDVLAVCLTAGMAVATAAAASAPAAPTQLARLLSRASDLLLLGADADAAWSGASSDGDRYCDAVSRLARRSASSGAALAMGVAELADQCRQDSASAADAAAQRASVLIAGPLGLCYLPAFVCLGLVPVIVGLAGDVLSTGVL